MVDYRAIDRFVAERIIQARQEAGLSKTEFAEKLGLSKQGYQHYESLRIPYTVQQVFQAARIFGRQVEWFLDLPTELSIEEQLILIRYRNAESAVQRVVMAALNAGQLEG